MALIYRSAWIVLCVAICWERASAESVNPETVETSTPPPATVEFDKADIAWVLCSTALVLSMTAPGLALFYGGLVRKKNILGVMMQCISLMGVMSVVWALWGYSLAFSGDNFGLIGDFGYFGMNGVLPEIGQEIPQEGTLPKTLHMLFQMMFFMITPGLICGAYAERMKFSSMLLFSVLWGTFVYCPVAHWVWSSAGWCAELNEHAAFRAIDFAGGTVVHVTSGVSALICALFVGKRLGHGHEPMPPHNLTYTCIGTGLLWMGWFGFNGGSALAADARAVNACLTTHLAAATGVMMWAGLEWILRGKPSILGACSGAVAGLVCITPACGSVSATSAMILGAAGGAVCFYACTTVKNHFKYDDSLDAFGVHGVGGSLGAILTGVFATRAVTGEKGLHGLIEGDAGQVVSQFVALAASAIWAIVGTVILLKLIDAAIGLRVTQAGELQGLDIQEHGEEGYIFL